MLSKFTHPQTGSVLFIQRPKEVADFVARQPRVLPQGPQQAPSISLGLLRLVLALLLVLVLAATFFLFGEERPDSVVRPALTNAQRAKAFRL